MSLLQPTRQGLATIARRASSSRSALKSLPALPSHRRCSPQQRNLHATPIAPRSDDPGGKPNDGSHPTVYDDFYNMLAPTDPNAEAALSIEAIKSDAVTLSDGLVLQTPIVLINGSCFMWDPPPLDGQKALPNGAGWEEWTNEKNMRETWKVLDVVEPKPEVLLFGTGASVLPPPPALRSYLNSLGIQLEVQSSQNAASTFNVLSEEGRKVAIALLLSDGKAVDRRRVGQQSSGSSSPSSPRQFSTSARSNLATPAATMSSSPSSSSPSPTPASHLTLHHFLLRSSVYALYRSYIRATQSIPNSLARYETIQFYRPGFQKTLEHTELSAARDSLDYQKRDFKRVAPGWELAGGNLPNSDGTRREVIAKFRGSRG